MQQNTIFVIYKFAAYFNFVWLNMNSNKDDFKQVKSFYEIFNHSSFSFANTLLFILKNTLQNSNNNELLKKDGKLWFNF